MWEDISPPPEAMVRTGFLIVNPLFNINCYHIEPQAIIFIILEENVHLMCKRVQWH